MFITSDEAEARYLLEQQWLQERQELQNQQDKSRCADYDFY